MQGKGGVRWLVDGANSMMALRCCSLHNQMTDFVDWQRAT